MSGVATVYTFTNNSGGDIAIKEQATPIGQWLNNISHLTSGGSNSAIETIDFSPDQLSNIRSRIGAIKNRFSSTISSLQLALENMSAARSQIRDANVTHETAELTRNQILLLVCVSMVAQANQLPQLGSSPPP